MLTTVVAAVAVLVLAGVAWCQKPEKEPGRAKPKPPAAEGFQPGDDMPFGPEAKPIPRRVEGFGPAPGPAMGRPGGPPRGDRTRPGPRSKDDATRPGPGGRFGVPRAGRPGGPPHPAGPPRWPHQDWEQLQKNDPEMYKLLREDEDLDRQSRQLAMQYRLAPKDGKEAIQKELEELVSKHFDVRQQRRALELKRLEEELQRLRDSIDNRNKLREQIVKKRVAELLGLDEGTRF